jgi:hypothetical protein
MKAHLKTLTLLSLSLVLIVGLSSCGQEAEKVGSATEGAAQEPSVETVAVGGSEVADADADSGAGTEQATVAPVDEAAARRAQFQAEMKAKMAARMEAQANPPAKLYDAEGHLVDGQGNHLHEEDEHDHGSEPKKANLGNLLSVKGGVINEKGQVIDRSAAKSKQQPAQKPAKNGEIVNPPILGNNNGPRLTFQIGQEKHDFGKLLQGMVAEHEFTLRSSGTEDLIIRQVKPTCGCTIAQVYYEGDAGERLSYIYGNVIPAGKTIWIPAKLHTKGKRGHQNVRVNITSTDPRGQTQLGLEADIDPFFVVMPSYLNFGQLRKGEVKTLDINISTVKNEALAMTIAPGNIPAGVTVDLQPTGALNDGRSPSWRLKATVGPDLVEGNLARTLMVLSDKVIEGGKPNPDGSPSVFQVSVSLSARIVGPFSFNPPYMSMGLVRPGQVLSRSVRITSHDEAFVMADHLPTVQIKGIAPANQEYPDWEYGERFTPRVTPVPGENAVDVELTCQGMPETLSGSFRGTLLLGLDHPEKKELIIPITGVCRGGVVPVRGVKPAGGK